MEKEKSSLSHSLSLTLFLSLSLSWVKSFEKFLKNDEEREVGSWCKKPNSEKIKADRSERENVKVEGITKCIRYRHKCLTSKGCRTFLQTKILLCIKLHYYKKFSALR